jgi:O-antigen/teichoic acid export membrane protein
MTATQAAMKSHRNPAHLRLSTNALGAFVFKGIGAVAGFALAMLLVRYLGPEQAGVYYTAMPLVMMASYFSRAGLDQLVMRETAGALSINHSPSTLLRNARNVVIIGFSLFAVLGIISAPWLSDFYEQPNLKSVLVILIPAVAGLAALNLAGQAIRGAGKILHSSFILFAGTNVVAVALLAAAWKGGDHFLGISSLLAATACFSTATLVTAALALFWLAPYVSHKNERLATEHRGISGAWSLFRTGQPLMLSGLAVMAMNWVDTLTLAAYRTSEEVTIYNSAFKVAQSVGFVLLAVVAVAGPRLSALHRAGKLEELRASVRKATNLTLIAALPAVLALWLAGDVIMSFFGPGFTSGALPLAILGTGFFAAAVTGPVGLVLIAAGQDKTLRNISIGVAIVNLPLNIVLAPAWGVLGTAIATASSMALLSAITAGYAKRVLASQPIANRTD